MILGLDGISFAVEDLAAARTFLNHWGLEPMPDKPDQWATRDGGIIAACDAASGQGGVGVREVIWGVDSPSSLGALAARLEGRWPCDYDGETLRLTDPAGVVLCFRVSQRRPVMVGTTPVNTPVAFQRVDRPGAFYKAAQPIKIGHVVFIVPDMEEGVRFYTEMLGFHVSDTYIGKGTFLRCAEEGEHHNLFLIHGDGNGPKFHHLAFLVSEIHEVFGGGMGVQAQGWNTRLGPGRHPVSSVYFWYFDCPMAGGAFEYYADSDYVTAKWVPRQLQQTPEWFTEWALDTGVRRYEGVQRTR